jgi:hypothetical protein
LTTIEYQQYTHEYTLLQLLDRSMSSDELSNLYAKYFGRFAHLPFSEGDEVFQFLISDCKITDKTICNICSLVLFLDVGIHNKSKLESLPKAVFFRIMTSAGMTPVDVCTVWQKLHGLEERVDQLEKGMANFAEITLALEQWVPGISDRLRRLEQGCPDFLSRLGDLEMRFPGLILKVDELLEAVPLLSDGLDLAMQRIQAFIPVAERVDAVEKNVALALRGVEALTPVVDPLEERIFALIRGNDVLQRYHQTAQRFLNAIFTTAVVMESNELALESTLVKSCLSAMAVLFPGFGEQIKAPGFIWDLYKHHEKKESYKRVLDALNPTGSFEQTGRILKNLAAFFTVAYQKDLSFGVIKYSPSFSKRVKTLFGTLIKGGGLFRQAAMCREGFLKLSSDRDVELLAQDHVSIAMEFIKSKTPAEVVAFQQLLQQNATPTEDDIQQISNVLLAAVFKVYPPNLDHDDDGN